MVKIFIEKGNKRMNLRVKDIDEAVKRLNINREEVIIVKNNELAPRNEKLNNSDEIKFLSVISGG